MTTPFQAARARRIVEEEVSFRLRFSFLQPLECIEEGMERLAAVIERQRAIA